MDEDGYLYLTDRATFMIISGGVNIYPQEIEACFALHPEVADVAVFGLPDEEMGEYVHAVVQLEDGVEGTDDLAEELRYLRPPTLGRLQGAPSDRLPGGLPPPAHRQALQEAPAGGVPGPPSG